MTAFVSALLPANGAIEAAISIAVLVIAFIGWLVQIAGSAKAQPPAPVNRPRPIPRPGGPPGQRPQPPRRDERLQSEIDAFLREVSGRKAPPRDEEVAIEIVPDEDLPEEQPRRLAPQSQPLFPAAHPSPIGAAPNPNQPSEWEREQQRLRRERQLSSVAERRLEATPLGAELRKHVEQFAAESLQLRREKELAERQLAEANAQLQAMRAQVAASPGAAPVGTGLEASRVAAMLKNRKTVKDAIVINEILGRPRGGNRRTAR
jgi:hypothetical protein